MIKNKIYSVVATGFGVGKIPFAPGTFGSLLAVFIWIFINNLFSKLNFSQINIDIFWVSFLTIFTVFGVYSANYYCKKHQKKDAKEIVIDEICGQLLTFLIAGIFMDIKSSYLLIFLAFLFFRLFDITKPFVIGLADKNVKGGIGVMLDDLLAGFAAAVLLYAVYAFILIR
jgi:phosphatidylglycerophosphatase A